MINPSELFNLLSDETRLRFLLLLQTENELCVCELCSILDYSQPKISRHLALLRKSGIVSDKRKGQWVYYSLNSILPKWVLNILEANLKNLQKIEPFSSDLAKLKQLKKRKPCE